MASIKATESKLKKKAYENHLECIAHLLIKSK